jgi:opacity protein-like surface antigen
VNVFAGQKWLNKSDWEPIEKQPELGILFAFGETRAPIHFAIDVFHATDKTTTDVTGVGAVDVEGTTTEYSLGVRKFFRRHAITHPHLGGGATVASGELRLENSGLGRIESDDSAFGLWIDGGITWRLAKHLNLGVEVRYTRYEFEFGTIFLENELKGGGFHAGALIGYGW